MTERVIEFVEDWVSVHIFAEGRPAQSEAKSLAQQCRSEALAAGIPASEIDDEFDDLAAFMSAQIQEANDREASN